MLGKGAAAKRFLDKLPQGTQAAYGYKSQIPIIQCSPQKRQKAAIANCAQNS